MTPDSLINGATLGRLTAILILIIGLILLAAWLIRRLGVGMTVARGAAKSRRLAILEIRPIDAQRRLVLVSRDETQHLLLIGGQNDLVVETGIAPPAEAEDPLSRVRFRDIVSESGGEARILRPGIRIDEPGDDA
ncbi:flagellar biosynthetic protein FliO [Oleispirillum naphthae]|uniref:flagellar biosynthetic protein FliO n=1 Tax=Oleispirillum naphthae TaxID=2838853 RepID=UPI0030825081